MPVRSKFKRPTRATKKKHISEISVSQKTVLRYRSGIQLFYKWRKSEGLAPSSSFSELDVQLGEYINFLYQNDMPLYRGGDVLSGLRNFTRGAAVFWKFLRHGIIVGSRFLNEPRPCLCILMLLKLSSVTIF